MKKTVYRLFSKLDPVQTLLLIGLISLLLAPLLIYVFPTNGPDSWDSSHPQLDDFGCAGNPSLVHISGFNWGNKETIAILVVYIGDHWTHVTCLPQVAGENWNGKFSLWREKNRYAIDPEELRYQGPDLDHPIADGSELGALVFTREDHVVFIGLDRRMHIDRDHAITRDRVYQLAEGNVFFLDEEGSFSQLPFKSDWIDLGIGEEEMDNILNFFEPFLTDGVQNPEQIPEGVPLEPIGR